VLQAKSVDPKLSLFVAGAMGIKGFNDATCGSDARFFCPSSLVLDSRGRIFVADSGNDSIRMLTIEGNVSTVAGSSGIPGHIDGTDYREVRFSCPIGLTRDNQDRLYVADAGNNCIRIVTFLSPRTQLERSGSTKYDGAAIVEVTTVFLGDEGVDHIWPTATLVDALSNVYLIDAPSQHICKIQPDGEYLFVFD
jgi:hypothetical protein